MATERNATEVPSAVDDPLFTQDQAAAYLAMTRNWVDEALRTGKIASYRVGNRLRVRKSDLDAYLESVRIEAVPSEGPRTWDRSKGAKTPRKKA